jgi:hypothetical protein
MLIVARSPRVAALVVALSATLPVARPALAQEGPSAAGDPGPPVTAPPVGHPHESPHESHHALRREPQRLAGVGLGVRLRGLGARRADDAVDPYLPTLVARDGYPLVGFHQDRFYLRDASDSFRLYTGLLLQADGRGAFGRGVASLDNESGGAPLRTRGSIRRARVELGGQIHGAWSFLMVGDFAGDRPRVEHALVDVQLHPMLHLTAGQQLVPFTMENRTHEAQYAWLERPLAVRFAQPFDKDVGLMAWGESRRGLFAYEAGVFGGDGPNRGAVDDRADLAARVVVKPLASTDSIARHIEFGASATYGMR